MGYTYDQRKRPQGRENTAPERATAPGPAFNALLPGTSAPQNAPSFDLDAAMKAKMENAFGDLSAVKNYTPLVQTQAPVQTGPYTGPVTHAVSGASLSPSVAGPMQAKKAYKETKSSKRDYIDDESEFVKQGDANYYPKLKIMSRMVYDYPELQGNIGSLERMKEEDDQEDSQEQPKSTSSTEKENITYRPRMKRKKTSDKPEPEHPKGQAYMSTQSTMLYPDEDFLFRSHKDYKNKENYARLSAFPLRMNATVDAAGEGMREFRAKKSKKNEDLRNLAAGLEYSGNHEMGHMLNYLLVKEMNRKNGFEERTKANRNDFRFGITAAELVEKALKQTMDPKEFAKLKRYEEDSLDIGGAWDPSVQLGEDEEWVTKDTDPRHKKGQIDLKGSGLGGDENNIGYTSAYGASSATEFVAEAFADVYKNGSQARPTSIKLVQIYEKNMKFFKLLNAEGQVAISDQSMPDMLESAIKMSYKLPKKKKSE